MLQEEVKVKKAVSKSVLTDDVIIENRHSYSVVGKISEIVPVLRKCDMMKSMGLDRAKRQAWKMIKKLPSTRAKDLISSAGDKLPTGIEVDAVVPVVDWYNDVQKYGSMSTSFLKQVYRARYTEIKHRIRDRKEQKLKDLQDFMCDAEDFNGLWVDDWRSPYRDSGCVEVKLKLPRNHKIQDYLRQLKDFYNREFKPSTMAWHNKYKAYCDREEDVSLDSNHRTLKKLGLTEDSERHSSAWVEEYLAQLGCEQ